MTPRRHGKLKIMNPAGMHAMYDLIIIGAGPGGTALPKPVRRVLTRVWRKQEIGIRV